MNKKYYKKEIKFKIESIMVTYLNPVLLCNKHLTDEHNNLEELYNWLRYGYDIAYFIGHKTSSRFEVGSVKNRHDEIVKEIKRRKMPHYSVLPIIDKKITRHYKDYKDYFVNRPYMLETMYKTCINCRVRINDYLNKQLAGKEFNIDYNRNLMPVTFKNWGDANLIWVKFKTPVTPENGTIVNSINDKTIYNTTIILNEFINRTHHLLSLF